MIYSITALSIGESWQELLRLILSKGSMVKDGGKSLVELCHVVVDLPDNLRLTDDIFETLYDKTIVKFMKTNFFGNDSIENWGYSYGQRLTNFAGINQLEEIIVKLKDNPWSKSATICLANPPHDRRHIPCVYSLDFKLRNHKLDITAYFRSQDAGKKYCADIYCIRKIQIDVARAINALPGRLILVSSSMHIYNEDLLHANKVVNYVDR